MGTEKSHLFFLTYESCYRWNSFTERKRHVHGKVISFVLKLFSSLIMLLENRRF